MNTRDIYTDLDIPEAEHMGGGHSSVEQAWRQPVLRVPSNQHRAPEKPETRCPLMLAFEWLETQRPGSLPGLCKPQLPRVTRDGG